MRGCSFCGWSIHATKWTRHWERVHKIKGKKHRRELGEGEWPCFPWWVETPVWSAPTPRKEQFEHERSSLILKYVFRGEKIKWHHKYIMEEMAKQEKMKFTNLHPQPKRNHTARFGKKMYEHIWREY